MQRAENWRPACRLDSRLELVYLTNFYEALHIGFLQSPEPRKKEKVNGMLRSCSSRREKFLKINFEWLMDFLKTVNAMPRNYQNKRERKVIQWDRGEFVLKR